MGEFIARLCQISDAYLTKMALFFYQSSFDYILYLVDFVNYLRIAT